jgi:mono/diheme cytochrome c family protein
MVVRRSPGFLAAAVAIFLAVTGYGLLQGDRGGAAQLLPYTDDKAVALGQARYAEHCAACHGANLEGAPDWRQPDADGFLPAPPHDASGHTWHHADALLIDITTRGTAAVVGRGYQSRMFGFGDVLTQDEIAAVLAYIKSTWPAEVIETHNEINRRHAE